MKKTALIMAGGCGERFWPRSRRSLPKQFLSLTNNGKTMIQLTIERILSLVDAEDIFIVTNQQYKQLVLRQLPAIPEQNILCEPCSKNTAPCIGLGAMYIAQKYGDALMFVLPSDHLIKYNSMFINTMNEACNIAESRSCLVTIGITPDYPETGYGYIKFNPMAYYGQAFKVDCFVEKPDLVTAKQYIDSEEYLWNSGMFTWTTSSILNSFKQYLPDLYQGLVKIRDSIGTSFEADIIQEVYQSFPSLSIDYGIMEKSDNIYTLPGTFGWDDVGSWLAVERIKQADDLGNVITGNIMTLDSSNCIMEGSDKLIAAVGLNNLIIVDTKDATLVCDKNSTNKIKKLLELLKKENLNEYI